MRGLGILWLTVALFYWGSTPAQAQYTTSDTLQAVVPGLVYKEFSRIIQTSGDVWRVTDPNAPFVGDPDNSPSTFLPNPVLTLTVADLQGAIKAVAVIDVWGGHVGTVGKQFRLNGNSWVDVPSIVNTPTNPECYTHQYSIEVEVPLADLVQGVNSFEGTSGGQTCYNFGWGQWGWYGFLIRVYYDPGLKTPPAGSITSPVAGATIGENAIFTAEATSGVGISRVDFVGYFDDFDVAGEGFYPGWQQSYHRLRTDSAVTLRRHIGTADVGPYNVAWDNTWIPDQTAGSIKAVARIRDTGGLWFVTDQVSGLTLERPGISVEMYKPTNVPEKYWVRAGQTKSSNFVIPAEDDLANADAARLQAATWNGISGQAEAGEGHWTQVNGWTTPDFGLNHFYSFDQIDIPANVLQNGTNTVAFFSASSHHGAEILWPGPGLIVRYIDYSNVPASVITQPSNTIVVEGGTANFSVGVVGADPLTYQWQQNGSDIPGATEATYTTPPVAVANDGDLYRCVVSNGIGGETSDEAVLTVLVPGPRNTVGQIVLYDFAEGGGSTVNDLSGVGLPLDLVIADPGAVSWTPGALSVDALTVIASAGAADKVINAVKASNELTIEAWVKPANLTQNGPARIVTLAPDPFERNFTLGQGVFGAASDVYEVRMRSTSTDLNGKPALSTPGGSLTTQLSHVVFTRTAAGVSRIFVDGVERSSGNTPGDLTNWDQSYRLGLANEVSGDRGWLGELHLVALYDRALPYADVLQNFAAGPAVETGEINAIVYPVQGLSGPVSLLALPNGAGDALAAAQQWSGVLGELRTFVDATIAVQLVDGLGDPVVGFQAEKVTVKSQNGGWVSCPETPLTADGPSDAAGIMTISGALFAGGHSEPGELLQVSVADPSLNSTSYPGGLPGLEYFVNSPDIAGDLSVDLSDVSEFAIIFGTGVYDYAADYVRDGVINLSDVAKISIGFGAGCPVVVAGGQVADEARSRNSVGVVFDAAGTMRTRLVAPGEQVDAYVVLEGPAVEAGLEAFELRVRVSENIVVHEQEFVGEGLDLAAGDAFVVGFSEPRHGALARPLRLVRLRVSVTDEEPAYFWVESSGLSQERLPAVAFKGAVHAVRPVSGDMSLPVASLNDEDFVLEGQQVPSSQLTMGILPNPFNPMTNIRFQLPVSGLVSLQIFDARGQLVATLVDEVLTAGEHAVTWRGTDRDGRAVASGVYVSRLETAAGTVVGKMMLVR